MEISFYYLFRIDVYRLVIDLQKDKLIILIIKVGIEKMSIMIFNLQVLFFYI